MNPRRSVWTRIRHAVFGTPQTHEQAEAMRRADLGNHRHSGETDARARSISNQLGPGF